MIWEICPSDCYARFILCSVPDECCRIIHPSGICIDPWKNKAERITCMWSGDMENDLCKTNTAIVVVTWTHEYVSRFYTQTRGGLRISKKEEGINRSDYLDVSPCDSMNTRKSSQLGKHGFGWLHIFTRACYHNEEILLWHWLRCTD